MDMISSTLEIRDRRGKKMRLANPFKKARSRDQSPEVVSALAGGGGSLSLTSGGGSSGPGVLGSPGSSLAGAGIRAGRLPGEVGSMVSGSGGGGGLQSNGTSGGPSNALTDGSTLGGGSARGGVSTLAGGVGGASTGGTKLGGYIFDDVEILPEMAARENQLADHIDEFSFTVVVLPGQDPGFVHLGWVTTRFKLSCSAVVSSCTPFDSEMETGNISQGSITNPPGIPTSAPSSTGGATGPTSFGYSETLEVRQAAVCLLESDLTLKSAVAERSSFMVHVGDLLARIGTPEDMAKRMSQGLSITCWVDTATGTLGFEINGRETGIRYQFFS
ncbi:unnamed protein product [Protopolystoma xenopodis]|uniref:SPRY domain-containing protein n=1 Tax=Protopolystoma xenopodis TaxID=117903 RepID=A0A448XJU9_9PLAT|nr:unnamed protein product [Protopolystoma xenopodis]